jgi:hypothetical protein
LLASVLVSTSHPFAAFPSQSVNPAAHAMPHAPLAHVAVEFAPLGHGEHDAPQVDGLALLAHCPPQSWKLASHASAHTPWAQLCTPLTTVPHEMEQSPQWVGLVSTSTHCCPQRVGACDGQPVTHAKEARVGAQSGAVLGQTALHAPQWAGWDRSVSHPFAATWSQSA